LEFAANLVGFVDIEWRRLEGGPLKKENDGRTERGHAFLGE